MNLSVSRAVTAWPPQIPFARSKIPNNYELLHAGPPKRKESTVFRNASLFLTFLHSYQKHVEFTCLCSYLLAVNDGYVDQYSCNLQAALWPYLVSARGQFLHNFLYGEIVGPRICWAKTCNSGRHRKVYCHKSNKQLDDHSFQRHFFYQVTSRLRFRHASLSCGWMGYGKRKKSVAGRERRRVKHLCPDTGYRPRGSKIHSYNVWAKFNSLM